MRGSIATDNQGPAGSGSCLRLDFEFVTGGGYCIVQKAFPMDLPENYEFTFQCRGTPGMAENNLEFKLLDERGENVWWVNRRAVTFPTTWQRFVNKKRQIEFAWGPAGAAAPLKRLGKLELVIASSGGGQGSLSFDNLTFRELPPSKPYEGKPGLSAASGAGHDAAFAMDRDIATGWVSPPFSKGEGSKALTIDFGTMREFGGLSIGWDPEHPARRFDIETSDDGTKWTRSYHSEGAASRVNHVPMPDTECRWVRIGVEQPPGNGAPVGIREIVVRPLEFGEPNGMYGVIAKESPRGWYPRYFLGEQRFWTVVGDAGGGEREALLGEDGTLEVTKRGYTIEPMLVTPRGLFTWEEGRRRAGLNADICHCRGCGARWMD